MGLLNRILFEAKTSFTNTRLPQLTVGEGGLFALPSYLKDRNITRIALVTGGSSLKDTPVELSPDDLMTILDRRL